VVTNHRVVESIRSEPGNRRTSLSSKFHMRFPCITGLDPVIFRGTVLVRITGSSPVMTIGGQNG
jgi:hypothetical protein